MISDPQSTVKSTKFRTLFSDFIYSNIFLRASLWPLVMINSLWTELSLRQLVKTISTGINALVARGEKVDRALVEVDGRVLYSYPPKPKQWSVVEDWAPQNE
jgi:hypothetical protein